MHRQKNEGFAKTGHLREGKWASNIFISPEATGNPTTECRGKDYFGNPTLIDSPNQKNQRTSR